MKKNLTLLLVCGMLSLDMQAQNFGGGLIAGLSTSQVAGDNLAGFNKIGMMAGIFTNRKINEYIKLQLEIIYIEKGSANPDFHMISKAEIEQISLSYIEVPISIILQQKEKIGIEIGILPAFIFSSTVNNQYYSYSGKEIDDAYEKYDFGLLAGVNYNLNDKIMLNTRISNSIIPIRPHDSGATTWINKGQYNTVLSFAIQYTIK